MNNIKYFFQFIIIIFLFLVFKVLGLKISIFISGKIFMLVGPLFRSKKICHQNLSIAFPKSNEMERNKILKDMWCNYGKIFAEYIFIKKIKNSQKITVENQDLLNLIKKDQKPVIFISGHFNNFELMAMHLEMSGINLAAIYRPLNNKFLNPIMENIRKKNICKKQIKKGISGTKEILKSFKNGSSVALMIDQRVSQGIKSKFFNKEALTTTIPAQFVKKFDANIVPIYIERLENNNFKLKIYKPLKFNKNTSIEKITLDLNLILEKMVIKNPSQWIWSHNRWK
ncbi:lysophospholipid acyltransferase family protein [Candidatus Pelagibacter sp.]|nr:lysophospholipid acyltransferase family protein [Candidatus Pelagibacter sp.]